MHSTYSLPERLDRLLRATAAKPDADTVHQLRTTIRRLEAHLNNDKKVAKLHKRLKRLRKRAGRVRDIDVQVLALSQLKTYGDSAAQKKVLRSLKRQRSQTEERLLTLVKDELRSKLSSRLEGAGPGPETASGREVPDAVSRATEEFASATANSEFTEESLHEFRITSKHIRYRLEPYESQPGAKHLLKELKRIQDAIGLWHDWVTLSVTAEEIVGGNPLVQEIHTRAKSLYVEAMHVISDVKLAMLAERDRRASARKPPGRATRKAEFKQALS